MEHYLREIFTPSSFTCTKLQPVMTTKTFYSGYRTFLPVERFLTSVVNKKGCFQKHHKKELLSFNHCRWYFLLLFRKLMGNTGPSPACLLCRWWVQDGVRFVLCHLMIGGWGWGGGLMYCALWRGCDGSTYGLIVLRLCRMSTPPANPPVGGCMPVNYCTLRGKKNRRRKRVRERGAQEYEEG